MKGQCGNVENRLMVGMILSGGVFPKLRNEEKGRRAGSGKYHF
jgi:hypothetical protein